MVLLYTTLVRPVLEYASVVWSPYQLGHIEAVEKIQTRLIRYIGLRLGYRYLEVPVEDLRSAFRLPELCIRRKISDLMMLHKLVNGDIDCPELLELVEFRTPGSTRSQTFSVGEPYLPGTSIIVPCHVYCEQGTRFPGTLSSSGLNLRLLKGIFSDVLV